MEYSLPTEINIITLNCWGLKFNISKLRKERLEEIGRQLSQTIPAPQIVCLQEVWSHDDYTAIRRSLRSLLPYGKFFHSGAFGAGLAILSHWPIESATMTPYALNGRPTAFWRGDWYVGKGIAHAALRIGSLPEDVVDVFTTHTHAPYEDDDSEDSEHSYRVHRQAQAWQLAKLLRAAANQPGHLVIAAGDFNMLPLGPEHRILTAHAPGLRDVWRVLHPDSSPGPASENSNSNHHHLRRKRQPPIPATVTQNLSHHGCTSNSILNTWRWPRARRARLGRGKPPLLEPSPETTPDDPHAQRLDYIFANTGARDVFPPPSSSVYDNDDDDDNKLDDHDDGEIDGEPLIGGWVVRDVRVGMTQRHPELGCSLSDHFSVEATLVFHTTASPYAAPSAQRRGGGDLGGGGDAGSTLAVPSLSGWPLPPGRLSATFRSWRSSSTPFAPLQHPSPAAATAATTTTTDAAGLAAEQGRDPTAADDIIIAPANGAYLSLHSPPSSTISHLPPGAMDLDTQLLSSLSSFHHPPIYNTPTPTPTPTPTSPLAPHQLTTLPPSAYTALLTEIHLYTARETDQTRLRTAHFCFWLFALVACCLATWFIPTDPDKISVTQNHAVNFVMVLVTSLGLVAGCVDGLLALLFFAGSERRALREFAWEVRNAKRIALGDLGVSVEGVRGEKYD
ncbi:unnamed protein product [Discula destructiva]